MARYAVIGLGRFGMTVAKILAENGMEVLSTKIRIWLMRLALL